LWNSLEPLREEQGGEEKQGKQDRQRKADEVFVHSRSTNFCIQPSRAKIATVSAMNTSTDMSLRHVYGLPDFGCLD
jgi:hypothetical protein